ncbi:MAG: TonB-dependent receptor [Pseudomonadota bacterium]
MGIIALSAAPLAAQGNARQQVVIEAQALDIALIEVGRRYGISVYAASDLTAGKSSRVVRGNLTAAEALNLVLSDSGLTYRRSSDDRYVVIRAQGALPGSRQSRPSAAEQSAEDSSALIIVTGTKQNRTVKETVESVAVTTSADIEEKTLFNVADILQRTANVSIRGETLNDLSIRGITLTGVGNTGQGATSQVYLDGAPLSSDGNQSAFNLWDVDQVEILRGPQSTTQGRNALAGALVIQTADPEYEFGAAARLLYGNQNQLQGSAMITGPIIRDQLAFRVAVDYREIDFEVLNVDTQTNDRFQQALTVRGKLLLEPEFAPGLRLELVGNYTDTDFGNFNTVSPPPPGDPRAEDFDIFGNETFGVQLARLEFNTATRATVDLSYELSPNFTLIGIGTYENVDRDIQFGFSDRGTGDTDTYSGEVRLAIDYGNITGWLGGYYFDQSTDGTTNIVFRPAVLGLPVDPVDSLLTFLSATDASTENFAIFGDATIELTERLRFNIGARYDSETVKLATAQNITADPPNCTIAPFIPGLGGLPCTVLVPTTMEPPQETDFDAFLPRASIAFDVSPNLTLGLLVARGYRAGGSFIFADPSNPGVVEVRSFDPEFLTNYELSLRSSVPSLGLTINANAFYTNWTDQQVTIPGEAGLAFNSDIVNAGSSELYGLEIEANAEITSEFNVFASLGLLQTEFTDFPFAAMGEFENLAGNEFNNAPNVTVSFGFAYNGDNGLFFSGNGTISDGGFTDVTNLKNEETDDYALFNARVGYRFGPMEIAAFVDNIFDERYVQNARLQIVNTTTGAIGPRNPPFLNVNEPRLYGVEVRARF